VTIATKSLGEKGPYATLTELLLSCEIEKNGLSRVPKSHFEKLGVGADQSSVSQVLLFRSGTSQLTAPKPARSNGFGILMEKTEGVRKPPINSEQIVQFRSYFTDNFQGAMGACITVEKPAKLEFYNENGPLKGTGSKNSQKFEPVAWMTKSDVTNSADYELFLMKELKDINKHYPLRLKVQDINKSMEQTELRALVRKTGPLDVGMGYPE